MQLGPYISYPEAKRQGLKHYFTGKPCKRGHVDIRRICDCTCRSCNRIYGKAWKKSDKGKASEARRRAAKNATALGAAIANAKVCTHDQISTLGSGYKGNHPNKTTGLGRESMMIYLGLQFEGDMNWQNYGDVWEIDHIRPKASFDLADPKQFKLCFNWINLQPLSREDNIGKADRWTYQQEVKWLEHLARLGYRGETYTVHT